MRYTVIADTWFTAPAVAFRALSGVVLMLRDAAGRAGSVAALPARFHVLFRWWFALGIPAFATVLAIYWLMVAKPLAAG